MKTKKKYTKKEYLKYVKELGYYNGVKLNPISFKDWKSFQPISDKIVGITNRTIKRLVKSSLK